MGKIGTNNVTRKEKLAGEIYDLNKQQGYKNPFSRKKAIKIMTSEDGYSESELKEIRDTLRKKTPKTITGKCTELDPKVAKANELRLAALKAGNKATRIVKKSNEEFQNATTEEEKDAIRKKYIDKRKEAKFLAGKAYREYDNYLAKEFHIHNVYSETNEKYCGSEKGFINWLQSKFCKRKRK